MRIDEPVPNMALSGRSVAGAKNTVADPRSVPQQRTTPQTSGSPLLQPEAEQWTPSGHSPRRERTASGAPPSGEQPSWRDVMIVNTLRMMIRHKVVVVLLVLLTTLSGAASTLLVPPFYIARASIFPPPSDNPLGSFGMAGVAGLVGSLGLGGGGTTQFHLYQEFVTSRTLIMQVLQMSLADVGYAGTLMQYLQIEEPDVNRRNELAVESIRVRIQFEVDKQTGIVSLGFTDTNPRIAAAVVNEIIQRLDRFDANVTAQRASERRQFIEKRMAEAAVDLNRAEENLETFRERNLRIGNAPELILEQARLQRELEFEQQIYLTLRKEYELARLEEERSVPVVNVLDLAVPPTVAAGPSLLRNAATGGILGVMIVVTMFVMMTLQPVRRLREWGILGTPQRP